MKRADMRLDYVLPVVKNYFFGAEEKDVFLFENFCLKYNFGYDFPASIWAGTSLRRRGRQPSA